MKKVSVKKNYLYNLIYQILTMIFPLITTPYVSRVLGAENIGIYSYTFSIITYFVVLGNLGIALYGQREIAYLQDNIKERSKVFWEIVITKLVTTTISTILFYFSFIRGTEYSLYYKILALYLLSTAIEIVWFFQGLEEFKKTVTRNIIVRLLCLASIFIFIKSEQDLWKYVLIYSLSEVLGNITLWVYVPKYVTKVKLKELNIKRHFKPTFELFIPQISLQIYNMIDRTMLGWAIQEKNEVGYYEQAQKIIRLLIAIVTSLGTVLAPRMANIFAQKDYNQMKEYMKKSLKFTYCLSIPMIAGIFLISNEFVPMFFGNGYEKVSILLKIISPIVLLTGLTNVIGNQYLLPTKKERIYTKSIIIGTLVNIILNYIFIPYGKAIAASITTIIGQVIILLIQCIYANKEFSMKNIIKQSKNYFIIGLLMFVGVSLIKEYISDNMYLCIVTGMVIYSTGLYLLKDEMMTSIVKYIKTKILKKN